MKKITAIIITGILLFSLPVLVFGVNYPEPSSQFFVNDFADCINDKDEKVMQEMAEKLYNQTKAQVVCVTVESLEGLEIRDYAINLAREWGIGEQDEDTGVLLILSTSDRKIDIEVGYGLEGTLTDGKTGRILDEYAMPFLKQNDFSSGLKEAYTVLINETYTEFGVTVDDYEPIEEKDDTSTIAIAKVFVMLFSAAVVVVLIRVSRHSGGNGPTDGSDDFNNSNHTGGFYVGGFGAGTSSGGFGGGSSFGGGGFSGGGGSFGGGGSSRGF